VPFHHKILRELGRKKIDFVVIWCKILREFDRKLCDFRTTADQKKKKKSAKPTYFYLTHMEYEESIDLATRKMKIFYC
jgi:hypothetical protein